MKRKIIIQLNSEITRLPSRGFHPGNRTGNAAGAHKKRKGRGSSYDRNYEKRQNSENLDE